MKKTRKYLSALELANRIILDFPHTYQEELYQELNRLGWYWNSDKKEWELNEQSAHDPTDLIKLRVWTSSKKVQRIASIFKKLARDYGFQLLEETDPYSCRPPKQLESRIYLTFQDTDDNRGE